MAKKLKPYLMENKQQIILNSMKSQGNQSVKLTTYS